MDVACVKSQVVMCCLSQLGASHGSAMSVQLLLDIAGREEFNLPHPSELPESPLGRVEFTWLSSTHICLTWMSRGKQRWCTLSLTIWSLSGRVQFPYPILSAAHFGPDISTNAKLLYIECLKTPRRHGDSQRFECNNCPLAVVVCKAAFGVNVLYYRTSKDGECWILCTET